MANAEELCTLVEMNEITSNRVKTVIAGDISATNALLGVYSIHPDNSKLTMVEALYDGQRIGFLGESPLDYVIAHLLSLIGLQKSDINAMVLAPAGPIDYDSNTCTLPNAGYTIDANSTGINTVFINDFKAIAYAVANFKNVEDIEHICLKHSECGYGENVEDGNIGIHGAGTGFGTARLVYKPSSGLYIPFDSEGGHKFLTADVSDDLDVGITKHLSGFCGGKPPILETALSGKGIMRIFEYFRNVLPYDVAEQYEAAEDKAEYVATMAKHTSLDRHSLRGRIFGITMDYFWKHYGMALHDLAVHENARGGIWVAGGIIRKNIRASVDEQMPDYHEPDGNIAKKIMDAFESGPTHSEWVNKIPVNVIMDKRIGLKGAIEVAFTPEYFSRERKF